MDEKTIRETVEKMKMAAPLKVVLLRRALAGEREALFVIAAKAE